MAGFLQWLDEALGARSPTTATRLAGIAVDITAADDEITVAETNVLRATATALGLAQHDYNKSQARHRDKLRSLKK